MPDTFGVTYIPKYVAFRFVHGVWEAVGSADSRAELQRRHGHDAVIRPYGDVPTLPPEPEAVPSYGTAYRYDHSGSRARA